MVITLPLCNRLPRMDAWPGELRFVGKIPKQTVSGPSLYQTLVAGPRFMTASPAKRIAMDGTIVSSVRA
nr:unnamed protein product [Digitaria exilis]